VGIKYYKNAFGIDSKILAETLRLKWHNMF
jgi:hypothetical protein